MSHSYFPILLVKHPILTKAAFTPARRTARRRWHRSRPLLGIRRPPSRRYPYVRHDPESELLPEVVSRSSLSGLSDNRNHGRKNALTIMPVPGSGPAASGPSRKEKKPKTGVETYHHVQPFDDGLSDGSASFYRCSWLCFSRSPLCRIARLH